MEHRLEQVATVDGVRFINDSQGTQPDAVIAALRAFPRPLVLIAGGRDKGVDLSGLGPVAAKRADAAVLIGESGPSLAELFRKSGVARVEQCLDELGICFCFAPLLHQAMKHVAPVRKKLGVPTLFNILGPLANPAGAPLQLLGVGRAELRSLLAEALTMLGSQRALVVHGADSLDEVTLAGPTHVTEAAGGRLAEFTWTPADFGLPESDLAGIRVSGPAESAAMIRGVLAGRGGPARDIVVANAAAALWTAGRHRSTEACAQQAAEAIRSGAAGGLLARLVEMTARP